MMIRKTSGHRTEGKEAKVALGTFTEAMHEANARNIESGVDVREMFHRLAKGGKYFSLYL